MVARLISVADMAEFAALDESAMDSRCRVLRRTEATDEDGRTDYGAATQVGPEVRCRLDRSGIRPEEAAAVGRAAEETAGTIALPLGTAVAADDVIEVATAWQTNRFEVVGTPWSGDHDSSLTVVVQREG